MRFNLCVLLILICFSCSKNDRETYKYLKTLGLGYHFYRGHYLSALDKVLDTNQKTLIHIPVTGAKAAGAYDKYQQVKEIIDLIGSKV